MDFLRKLFGTQDPEVSHKTSAPIQQLDHKEADTLFDPSRLCKAYQSGNCIIQQQDTGPCTWDPANWENCNVVLENKKFHGTW